MQKEKHAMETGQMQINGMKIKGTGSEVLALTKDKNIIAVEILDFDNNNMITPIN